MEVSTYLCRNTSSNLQAFLRAKLVVLETRIGSIGEGKVDKTGKERNQRPVLDHNFGNSILISGNCCPRR
jgi:hypothetical protein